MISYNKYTFTLFNKAYEPEYLHLSCTSALWTTCEITAVLRNKTTTLTRARKGQPKITKEKKKEPVIVLTINLWSHVTIFFLANLVDFAETGATFGRAPV